MKGHPSKIEKNSCRTRADLWPHRRHHRGTRENNGKRTNALQAKAHMLGEDDIIRHFESWVLVQMPAESPSGQAIQPLYRKMLETILNIAFGMTRRRHRPWGLLRNQIDCQANEHSITAEIAHSLRWRVFSDFVTWSETEDKLVCQKKPSASGVRQLMPYQKYIW